jgi:hypothetical protein
VGKGSKQRPTDKLQFDENYDSINWVRREDEKEDEPRLTKEQMKVLLKAVKEALDVD